MYVSKRGGQFTIIFEGKKYTTNFLYQCNFTDDSIQLGKKSIQIVYHDTLKNKIEFVEIDFREFKGPKKKTAREILALFDMYKDNICQGQGMEK